MWFCRREGFWKIITFPRELRQWILQIFLWRFACSWCTQFVASVFVYIGLQSLLDGKFNTSLSWLDHYSCLLELWTQTHRIQGIAIVQLQTVIMLSIIQSSSVTTTEKWSISHTFGDEVVPVIPVHSSLSESDCYHRHRRRRRQ